MRKFLLSAIAVAALVIAMAAPSSANAAPWRTRYYYSYPAYSATYYYPSYGYAYAPTTVYYDSTPTSTLTTPTYTYSSYYAPAPVYSYSSYYAPAPVYSYSSYYAPAPVYGGVYISGGRRWRW